MTIKRYEYDKRAPGMFKNSAGSWVKFIEHERVIAELAEALQAMLDFHVAQGLYGERKDRAMAALEQAGRPGAAVAATRGVKS